MAKRIDDDVLVALRQAKTEGNGLWLAGQLDRKLYVKVNEVLEALGGKWNRKAKRHLFDGAAADLLGDVLTTGEYVDMKQEFQFFETPYSLSKRMCGIAQICLVSRVLEPSAGRGAIAKTARAFGATVHCSELQPKLADELQAEGFNTVQCDFLQQEPDPIYDAVVMNPPFNKSQDLSHVRHAYDFLAPSGVLVAVMGMGWTFRQDRKATEFREWLNARKYCEMEELPAGTFKQSGTMVNTVLVTIKKDI
jgi:predicted RNA methylase